MFIEKLNRMRIAKCLCGLLLFIAVASCQKKQTKLLVFSKTAGFRHESIAAGKKALMKIGETENYVVDTTEDAERFTEDNLKNYAAVIFLNTTGDVLNFSQQNAFERYIQAGGGFVGIHSATDTEYDWPWYGKLVGAYFEGHPATQKAKIEVVDKTHPSTEFLDKFWERTDEWYNFKSLNPDVKVLAKIDEKSYTGGTHKGNHPMVWYHDYDGGRAFYTEFGHTPESYADEKYIKHVIGGIKYAIGNNELDYAKAHTAAIPDASRFSLQVLAAWLNEPMEIAVSKKGNVYFTQRHGQLMMFQEKLKQIGFLDVESRQGNGLIGLALDPNFELNNQVYMFYTSKDLKHTLARFELKNKNTLDTTTRKILLEIPIELESSAHTGGSLVFDKQGNLFISVGDNTVPFESSGYAPIDERQGRIIFDAQRSSANTNDLRGKILRIHPTPDGKYTIPEGNLFPQNTANTRPEIYAMGCRNPYRMSVDPHTSIPYWGEVGPDAGTDSTLGPRGHDEINRAANPGFFGWPYFVGNSKAYPNYDFATKTLGKKFDAKAPYNESPNNTGLKNLPPAQKALVWYPYANSTEFPMLGKGSRNAMAGPFYYANDYKNSTVKFPKYYDGKMLIYDWMRNWVMAVTISKSGTIEHIEPMFSNMQFNNIIDMQFGADGALYMIEYGTIWYADNKNARLIKIEYSEGNRPPIVAATTSDTVGIAPLKSKFSIGNSYDPDGDEVIYEWRFENKKIDSREKNPVYTFTKNGVYFPTLTVTDIHGKSTVQTMRVIVGNSYPVLKLETLRKNSTFFWDNEPLKYNVTIRDKEDKTPNDKGLRISLTYVAEGKDIPGIALGHQMEKPQTTTTLFDKPIFKDSDCKSCHAIDKKSVGPSFNDVAKKYKDDPKSASYLANKIKVGGGGVWGEHAMSAHPQLSKATIDAMVNYILALGNEENKQTSDKNEGSFALNAHKGKSEEGMYLLIATYKDRGAEGVGSLSTTKQVILRNPKLLASNYDFHLTSGPVKLKDGIGTYEGGIENGCFLGFKEIDLTSVSSIDVRVNSKFATGKIEIRLGSKEGKKIGVIPVKATGKWDDFYVVNTPIEATQGVHDVYFVFIDDLQTAARGDLGMINIHWMNFNN